MTRKYTGAMHPLDRAMENHPMMMMKSPMMIMTPIMKKKKQTKRLIRRKRVVPMPMPTLQREKPTAMPTPKMAMKIKKMMARRARRGVVLLIKRMMTRRV